VKISSTPLWKSEGIFQSEILRYPKKKFLVSRFPGFVHWPSDKSSIKMKTVADTGRMMLTGESTYKNMSQHHFFFNINLTSRISGAGSIIGHGAEISAINRLKKWHE
jgi:hypothetical protein